MRIHLLLVALLLLTGCHGIWPFSSAPSNEIAEAIATMRGVDPNLLNEEQQKTKAQELGKAWEVIAGAGSEGALAIKEELRCLHARQEKDDFFQLGAAAILWNARKVEEADTVAAIWSGDVDLTASHPYVFYTAFDAAQTRNPRVLPMLTALLGHHAGEMFFPQHAFTIQGDLFLEFIWGAYGPAGIDRLEEVLSASENETVLASATYLIGISQHFQSLPRLRELARTGPEKARFAAIAALGLFGHPDDFDFLVQGLKGSDGQQAVVFASALYEYEDLRAVPVLVPLLESGDPSLFGEVVACLVHLPTEEGISALRHCSLRSTGSRETCEKAFSYLARSGCGSDDITCQTDWLREHEAATYRMQPTDKPLSHDEFLKAVDSWKEKRRITNGEYSWIENRHVLSAATADDIPVLMDLAARLYPRLSDECLEEVRILQNVIKHLSRTRYRRETGVCEKITRLE